MTISVLDHGAATASAATAGATLGGLHDAADGVDQDRLPCRVFDPELWFADTPVDLEHAKRLCGDCPVRELCLAGAVEREEPWGVWGGELFERGVVIPRKRPRGRPRKSDRMASATSAA